MNKYFFQRYSEFIEKTIMKQSQMNGDWPTRSVLVISVLPVPELVWVWVVHLVVHCVVGGGRGGPRGLSRHPALLLLLLSRGGRGPACSGRGGGRSCPGPGPSLHSEHIHVGRPAREQSSNTREYRCRNQSFCPISLIIRCALISENRTYVYADML